MRRQLDDDQPLAATRLGVFRGEAGAPDAPSPPPTVPLTPAAHPTGWAALLRERAWVQPITTPALAWTAAAIAVALALSAWLLLPRQSSSPAPAPVPVTHSALPQASAATIVVDVGGRVRHPGLVTLPVGARVADALRAAGGALRAADTVTLDLAARVNDGQLLLIGIPGAGGDGTAAGTEQPQPVSLNTATVDQLDALPGVGPVLAHHIVEWRTAHGGFTAVTQLQQVTGVGPRTFARLKDLVSL